MMIPRTPKRKRLDDPLVSPYFSRTKRDARNSPAIESADESTNIESSDDDTSGSILTDPLFLFHFRTYLHLYQQLYLAKPVLIQETVAHDPWKVLIAVTLLNKTSGKLAIPLFRDMMNWWPTPLVLSQVREEDLAEILKPLGCYSIRAKRLLALSRAYLHDPPRSTDLRPTDLSLPISNALPRSPRKRTRYPPTPISHLPGAGPYALDSYRIFCTTLDVPSSDEWKSVMPSDKELVRFLRWKWALVERKLWLPDVGVIRNIREDDLRLLIDHLGRTQP